jgi:hypothetical protein
MQHVVEALLGNRIGQGHVLQFVFASAPRKILIVRLKRVVRETVRGMDVLGLLAGAGNVGAVTLLVEPAQLSLAESLSEHEIGNRVSQAECSIGVAANEDCGTATTDRRNRHVKKKRGMLIPTLFLGYFHHGLRQDGVGPRINIDRVVKGVGRELVAVKPPVVGDGLTQGREGGPKRVAGERLAINDRDSVIL